VNPAEVAWLILNDESDPFAWVAELTRRPAWHSLAACRGTDPAAFIIGRGANAAIVDRARAVCSRCTVSEQCLDFAMADPDAMGIWSGTTAQERRAMRVA
jgi:WhiB family redox-sensing transcriptional regulator